MHVSTCDGADENDYSFIFLILESSHSFNCENYVNKYILNKIKI